MEKSFALDFKEKFRFLEEYGFVFAVDPFNKERPCYKNLQGEIIMWFQRGFDKEIYVQVPSKEVSKTLTLNYDITKIHITEKAMDIKIY